MTGWRNIKFERAHRYADQFVKLIDMACVSVLVAGEVRRRCEVTSSPIEIVAVPIVIQEYDLFNDPLPPVNVLEDTLKRLIAQQRVDERVERRRGKKVKNEHPMKMLFRADSGMLCPVDLWVTTTAKWGAVLALRTGPYGLRSRLVTPQRSVSVSGGAGLLPREMQLSEQEGLVDRTDGTGLDTRTETMFWQIIGQQELPPEERR